MCGAPIVSYRQVLLEARQMQPFLGLRTCGALQDIMFFVDMRLDWLSDANHRLHAHGVF